MSQSLKRVGPPPKRIGPPPRRVEDPDGLIPIEVGMVFDINGRPHVCVEATSAGPILRWNSDPRDRVRLLGGRTGPHKVLKRLGVLEIEYFLARPRASLREDNNNGATESKNGMAKKNKNSKKNGAERKEGKCAFIERHLLLKGSERMTKSAIVKLTLKQFPGSNEKTIKNTVNWCAHHDLPNKGKTSNHLDESRAGSEEKAPKSAGKAKGKSAGKKSGPPPRKPAAVEQAQEPANGPETTAEG